MNHFDDKVVYRISFDSNSDIDNNRKSSKHIHTVTHYINQTFFLNCF